MDLQAVRGEGCAHFVGERGTLLQFVRQKGFYRMLFALALPIALQDLIRFALNLVDNVMVGSLSESALSAVSLANQPFFIFALACFGLSTGGVILVSQYHGKGDLKAVQSAISITVVITTAFALVVTLVVLLFPEALLSLYTADAEVIALGAKYMRICCWAYLFYGITITLIYLLRGVKVVRAAMFINLTGFVVNVFFNWVFIYGNLGAPAMGVEGAALGTLIARAVEMALLLLYLALWEKKLQLRLKNMFKLDKTLLSDFLRVGLPVVGNEVGWAIGISLQTLVLSRMGTDALAASSIVGAVNQLMCVMLFGVGAAASVIIGNRIGAGRTADIHDYAYTLTALGVGVGAASALLLFFARPLILLLYPALSAGTYGLTMDMLAISAGLMIFQSVGTMSAIGVLRGGGGHPLFLAHRRGHHLAVLAAPGHAAGLGVLAVRSPGIRRPQGG